jgi:xylan 1,4-beta-xylosidase
VDARRIAVLLWHYHDDDVPGPDAEVRLVLRHVPFADGEVRVRHYRIDKEHSNAFSAWKRMGSPPQPTQEQYTRLQIAGQLATLETPQPGRVLNSTAELKLALPRQAVDLLIFEGAGGAPK